MRKVVGLGLVFMLGMPDATPAATVRAVVDALSRQDAQAVFSRFDQAKLKLASKKLAAIFGGQSAADKMSVTELTTEIVGSEAHVKVTIVADGARGHEVVAKHEPVDLRRIAGDWKIVFNPKNRNTMFGFLATLASSPSANLPYDGDHSVPLVYSHMKQIGLAILMYSGDHNDRFPPSAKNLRHDLERYTRHSDVWQDPYGKPLDVRINPYLLGKRFETISRPAECVMLTLGPKGALRFDKDRTPVVFVDGHAKHIDRDKIGTLKWR